MISVCIDVPEAFHLKSEYVFRFFSLAWGLPVRCTRSSLPDAHIIYTQEPWKYATRRDAIVIRFDMALYSNRTVCRLVPVEDFQIWDSGTESLDTDFIGSTFRLLTMQDESQVPAELRDDSGAFSVEALPAFRKAAVRLPLADFNAKLVLRRLLQLHPRMAEHILKAWPAGAGYAFSVTHDTDAVSLGALKELAQNLVQLIVVGDRTYLDTCLNGLHLMANLNAHPGDGFPLWREYEESIRIRSCFYLSAPMSDSEECKSDALGHQIDWDLLRRMTEDGWEFGIHPPRNAKVDEESFITGKNLIVEKLGGSVGGLRHHWWALDWMRPFETLRKDENAGFRYDSSLAWRGSPGFRAGTCFPFQPYDLERDVPLKIYELPNSITDGQIIDRHANVASGVEKCSEIIDTVRQVGGMSVIDWHTESICDSSIWRNTFAVLKRLLNNLSSNGDAWIATPSEILDHWRNRAQRLNCC
jgi:peptidoglycan/xylan/chitin deacetylase (PgdA/CDA1 family)